MSDEANPPNEAPPATPPAAPAQQPPANGALAVPPEVQAMVDARVREAEERVRNAAWKQAREHYEGKQKPASTPPPQPNQPAPAQSAPASGLTAQDFLRVSTFTSAAGEYAIPPKGMEMLLGRVMEEKPADVPAWMATQATEWGWTKKAGQQPAGTQPNPVTPQAPTVPSTHRAPPPPTPTFTESTPILTIASSGQFGAVDKLVEDLGLDKFVEKLNAELKRTRVPLT